MSATSLSAPPGPIIVDNGTGYVKAGFAGDNLPRHSFPSMVGRPTLRAEEDLLDTSALKDIMVGDEAAANRRALEISYPMENGIIRNWEDMETVRRAYTHAAYSNAVSCTKSPP